MWSEVGPNQMRPAPTNAGMLSRAFNWHDALAVLCRSGSVKRGLSENLLPSLFSQEIKQQQGSCFLTAFSYIHHRMDHTTKLAFKHTTRCLGEYKATYTWTHVCFLLAWPRQHMWFFVLHISYRFASGGNLKAAVLATHNLPLVWWLSVTSVIWLHHLPQAVPPLGSSESIAVFLVCHFIMLSVFEVVESQNWFTFDLSWNENKTLAHAKFY